MVSKNGKKGGDLDIMTRRVTKHEDSFYVNLPPRFVKRNRLKVGMQLFVISGKVAVITTAGCTQERLSKIMAFVKKCTIN